MNLKTERKTGPPMPTPDQINNIGCRRMGWMLEGNWHWSIVFTDRMSQTKPRVSPMDSEFTETNLGNCLNAQGPNGPNE
jgi:hypothetical protein